MTAFTKAMAYRIRLSFTIGELLFVAAVVGAFNLIWPAMPQWVFLIVGVVMGVAKDAWRRHQATADTEDGRNVWQATASH